MDVAVPGDEDLFKDPNFQPGDFCPLAKTSVPDSPASLGGTLLGTTDRSWAVKLNDVNARIHILKKKSNSLQMNIFPPRTLASAHGNVRGPSRTRHCRHQKWLAVPRHRGGLHTCRLVLTLKKLFLRWPLPASLSYSYCTGNYCLS